MAYQLPPELVSQGRSPQFAGFIEHFFVHTGALSRGEVDFAFLDGLSPRERELATEILRLNLGLKHTHIIDGIAYFKDLVSVPVLREMLAKEDSLSRQLTLAGALWKIVRDPVFVVCLNRMKACHSGSIKTAHLRQVLWLKDERTIDFLIDLMDDPDNFVGCQALKLLNEMELGRRFFTPSHQFPNQAEYYRERRHDAGLRARLIANIPDG